MCDGVRKDGMWGGWGRAIYLTIMWPRRMARGAVEEGRYTSLSCDLEGWHVGRLRKGDIPHYHVTSKDGTWGGWGRAIYLTIMWPRRMARGAVEEGRYTSLSCDLEGWHVGRLRKGDIPHYHHVTSNLEGWHVGRLRKGDIPHYHVTSKDGTWGGWGRAIYLTIMWPRRMARGTVEEGRYTSLSCDLEGWHVGRLRKGDIPHYHVTSKDGTWDGWGRAICLTIMWPRLCCITDVTFIKKFNGSRTRHWLS